MSRPPRPILPKMPISRHDDGKPVLAFYEFAQVRSNSCGAGSATTSTGVVDRRLDGFEDLLRDRVMNNRRPWPEPLQKELDTHEAVSTRCGPMARAIASGTGS